MNNTSTETKRLADSVVSVAATIAEIIEARVKELGVAMAQQSSAHSEGIPPSVEGWVNTKAAADHLKVSQRTLRTWMKKQWVPYLHMGRSVRFRLSDVDKAVNRRFQSYDRWDA